MVTRFWFHDYNLGRFLLFCKNMSFKSFYLLISAALILGFSSSCTQAKAGNVKSDLTDWVEGLLTPSSTTLEKAENGYSLKGVLKGQPEHLLMLWEMDPKTGQTFLDSVRTDKAGNFALTGNVKEPIFCQLQWGEQAAIYMVIDNKTKAKLDINPTDGTYGVEGKGTEGIVDMKDLLDINSRYFTELQQIEAQANNLPRTEDGYALGATLQTKYNSLLVQRLNEIKTLAMSKEKSLMPAFVVSFGVIEGEDMDLMKHAIDACKSLNPNSKYLKDLTQRYETEKVLAIGSVAPEIKLPQPNGDSLALSSLRGQVVLIDFWASWCGPCRRENPFNTQLYKKYHSKGFEVYGVSLDDNKERWKSAIAADSLQWKHVSDLRKWSSAVVPMYKVTGIPATYLIDKDGKIIAKGLRGEALAAKLEEIFSKQ